jgi:hypothetical protein
MEAQALRWIVWAQACFLSGMLVAILLKPEGLRANDGISYYGTYSRTVLPYLVSLLGAAFFSWQAAMIITSPDLKLIRTGLAAGSLLAVAVAVTPYTVNPALNFAHIVAGSALFSLQLFLSFLLVYRLHYNMWAVMLALVELVAGIVCAHFLRPTQGLLIQFQILFQIAFGLMLVLSLKLVASSK